MPRFSIVVPAYNVESCLARCLNSLVNQTFGDFEVVCVDDTSHDGTPSILESYRTRDARVRVVRNEQNLHLFATRHVGVRETSGEYVLFVDADDELTPDALECLDAQLRSNPVDILQFPMQVLAEPGAEYELSADSWYMHESQPKAVYGSEIVDCICYQQPDDMCMHHRAFRGDLARNVLHELGYEPGLHAAEDITELVALMVAAESYEVIGGKPLYVYYVGRGLSAHASTIDREQFARICTAKHKCYDNLMRYLDAHGVVEAKVRVPVAWRWRYSCIQTLYQWQGSVALDDRVAAICDFADLWPRAWVLPSVYQCVADDARCLAEGDGRGRSFDEVKRSFLANLESLATLFERCDEAGVNPAESSVAWAEMRKRFESDDFLGAAFDDVREDDAHLLWSISSLCLFQRNETWMADDRDARARFELMETRQALQALQAEAAGQSESKLSKVSRALHRGLRTRGKGNGK